MKMRVNGAELSYQMTGDANDMVVLAHGLLMSGEMFAGQVAAFNDRYRLVTFDFRGHGESEVTPSGYDMETLTEDTADLIRALGVAPSHFVGFSLGGFVGIRLAGRHPELVRSLVLIGTSADPEPWLTAIRYRLLVNLTRVLGLRAVQPLVLPIMFGKSYLAAPILAGKRDELRQKLLSNNHEAVIKATEAVISRKPVPEEASRITAPTLILRGKEDRARSLAEAIRLQNLIPGSELDEISEAGHTAPLENPQAVNQLLRLFWKSQAT